MRSVPQIARTAYLYPAYDCLKTNRYGCLHRIFLYCTAATSNKPCALSAIHCSNNSPVAPHHYHTRLALYELVHLHIMQGCDSGPVLCLQGLNGTGRVLLYPPGSKNGVVTCTEVPNAIQTIRRGWQRFDMEILGSCQWWLH